MAQTNAERQQAWRDRQKALIRPPGPAELAGPTGPAGPARANNCSLQHSLAAVRASVEGDAWAAAFWRQAFAELKAARGVGEWQAAAALFARRAAQHQWPREDVAAFAKALTDL
jgi:hypothetical protein